MNNKPAIAITNSFIGTKSASRIIAGSGVAGRNGLVQGAGTVLRAAQ